MATSLPIDQESEAFTVVKNADGKWRFIHFKVTASGEVSGVVDAPEPNMRDITINIAKVAMQKYWNRQ